jgi:proline racemase
VERVAFRNVPAYVIARDVAAGDVRADVAYGGAIYAFVPAADLGLPISAEALPELIDAGRDIKAALEGTDVAVHPDDPRLSGIYGTVIHEQLAPAHHRNVVVFADGEVDRSPTGSATSARTALLADDGALDDDASWVNESIIGTSFRASLVGRVPNGVLTEVQGTAYRTGQHRFVLDPRDELGTGFILR